MGQSWFKGLHRPPGAPEQELPDPDVEDAEIDVDLETSEDECVNLESSEDSASSDLGIIAISDSESDDEGIDLNFCEESSEESVFSVFEVSDSEDEGGGVLDVESEPIGV